MQHCVLQARGRQLDLSKTQVMGILNVTPDSFSDGGQFTGREQALCHARQMVADGAAMIDIGGESTRPGAAEVPLQQELDRVIPVIEAVAAECDCWISVDTSKPGVMREAAAAGAHLINDVRALQLDGALQAAAETGLPVCLMHMQGQPDTMQQQPAYDDLLADIRRFFTERIVSCEFAGIGREQIVLDPGFGFGKTLQHNYQLLARLKEFADMGLPLLAGLSRKSMIGNLLGRQPDERLAGSLACALLAAERGASIIRCHDVRETVDALAVRQAMLDQLR